MKISRFLATAGFVSSLLSSSAPAIANPATVADVTGKTFCMNSGDRETYLSGGRYIGKQWGDGTWQFMSDGVVSVQAKKANWVSSIEKLADGSFEFRVTAQNFVHIGHYCK